MPNFPLAVLIFIYMYVVSNFKDKSISTWTIDDVRDFLSYLKLQHHIPIFVTNKANGASIFTFHLLTQFS